MESIKIDIGFIPCFQDPEKLSRLNHLIKVNSDLMLHQVMAGTGCSIDPSFQVLLLLYDLDYADPFIVVYHVSEPNEPIQFRPLLEGFPELPLECPHCDEEITDRTELRYDFLFQLKADNIEMVISTDAE